MRDDYRSVHRHELDAARREAEPRPKEKAPFHYQSDAQLYADELKAKVERAVRSGDYSALEP